MNDYIKITPVKSYLFCLFMNKLIGESHFTVLSFILCFPDFILFESIKITEGDKLFLRL